MLRNAPRLLNTLEKEVLEAVHPSEYGSSQ